MLREEKGITLVALIITIIILIILAAVTITSLTHDDLANTAVQGTQNYAHAQNVETKMLQNVYNLLNGVSYNISTMK